MEDNHPRFALSLTSPVPSSWTWGSPAPPLSIQLVDASTNTPVTTVSGWRVGAMFIDNQGKCLNFDPSSASAATPSSWEVVQGHVIVENLPLPILPAPGSLFRLSIAVTHPTAASSMVRPFLTSEFGMQGTRGASVGSSCQTNPPAQPFVLPFAASLGLRTVEDVARVWYADRHFPKFDVEVFDRSSGEIVKSNGWKIQVCVLDAFGQRVNHVIHDYEEFGTQTLRQGTCSFSGMRFSTVSSKCGGHYRLLIQAISPDMARAACQTLVTDKIQILSYRLYHAQKLPLERLTPFDAVAKMPGIGTLYAKRFAGLGVSKVGHLAAVDPKALGEDGCHRLLCSLRKERGSMTLAKLTKYIDQARDIVKRWKEDQQNDHGEGAQTPPSPPNRCASASSAALAASESQNQLQFQQQEQYPSHHMPGHSSLQHAPQTPPNPRTPESDVVSSSGGSEPQPELNDFELNDLPPSCAPWEAGQLLSDLQLVRPSVGSLPCLFDGEFDDDQRPAKRARTMSSSAAAAAAAAATDHPSSCSFRVVQIF